MAAEERDRAFEAFVAARSPALLRTAYLVTGDGPASERLLREALATTYLDWRRIDEREGREEHARRVMLTAYAATAPTVQPAAPTTYPTELHDRIWSSLRGLTARQRAVLVLGIRDRLDDDEVARVLGCSRKSVQVDAAHALDAVRAKATGRPPAADASAADPSGPAPAPLSVASLNTAIRETLTSRADDVHPPLSLADDARDRAEVIHRRLRSRRLTAAAVAAGLVVVVALGAALINGPDAGRASPAISPPSSPTASATPKPASSVVAVPDTVLRLARDNEALISYGSAIIDATAGTTMVTVQSDPANGASRGEEILALSRAVFGYVVLTRAEGIGPASTPRVLSYIRPDGSRVELGRTTVDGSGFAVAPDGLSVVHVIEGPVSGENAVGPGQSELVVQDLSADVINRITVVGLVTPISVTPEAVVFRRIDDSTNPSFVWQRATGEITPLELGEDAVAVQVHDTRVLLRSGVRRDCVAVTGVVDPSRPDRLWRRCGVFGTTGFDPTGSNVATVTSPEATSKLIVLDAQTGARAYTSPLVPGFPFQLEWTAHGDRVLIASVGAQGMVTYSALGTGTGAGGGVVTRASYQVPQGLVVLGHELPLPASG